MGCGTALPSLALFQSAVAAKSSSGTSTPAALFLLLADYNPSVLQLVTLPNVMLTWALQLKDTEPALKEAFSLENELELTDEVKGAFRDFLPAANITLDWISGGWSAEFVDLIYSAKAPDDPSASCDALVMGAETIYSPFALDSFYHTVMDVLRRESQRGLGRKAEALVAAKRLYFGVGGSLDDFIAKAKDGGALVEELREEADGVRRGVIRCKLVGS